MPKVLITGVAGFIGMHTAIKLLGEGWVVVGIDNLNSYYDTRLKRDRILNIQNHRNSNKFRFYEADINDFEWHVLKDIEYVMHFAAQAGIRYSLDNPRAYLYSNLLGFQSVIDFAVKSRVSKFIYASSSSVYGKTDIVPFSESAICNNPESYYAATKISNEVVAKAYYNTHNLSSLGLRFFTVYGPWGRPDMAPMLFANAAMKGDKIKVFNHGKQKRDFTYISDIVNAIYSLTLISLNDGAEIVNIGKGSPDDLMLFIDQIEKASGKNLKKKFCDAQLGDVEITFADVSKLYNMIGYLPSISLEQGIPKFIEWFKENFKKYN